MRIVAGTARGRALQGPKKADKIRPTADRVRETLFNILGQWVDGLVVLDLYAGTGALALEALSRGASRAVLVDSDREALGLCRDNTAALGFEKQVTVLPLSVERAYADLGRRGESFDSIFADPPYAANAVPAILTGVATGALLRPDGRLCIEHDKREPAPERHQGLVQVDQRKFGDTRITFYGLEAPS